MSRVRPPSPACRNGSWSFDREPVLLRVRGWARGERLAGGSGGTTIPAMLLRRVGVIVIAGYLACESLRAAPQSWELRGGRWVEATTQQAATAPAPDPVIEEAEELLG